MNISSTAATLALALLAWIALYKMDMGLDAGETLVVVGLSAGVVSLARWAWSKRRAEKE